MHDVVLDSNQPLPTAEPISAPTRRRWIIAFGLYTGITNIGFTNAVWVTYLFVHGYSPLAIGLFETLFHVAKFAAEVPTGAFADLVGRRASLVIAAILNILSTVLYFVPTVPLIVASFALSGIAYAFRGGAEDALLWYISGKDGETQQAQAYAKIFSRMFVISTIGVLIGASVGGYLGQIMLFLPFIAQLVVYGIGIIFLVRLPEQRARIHERLQPLRHIVIGLHAAWLDPVLLGILLLGAVTDGAWTTIFYYSQLGFRAVGFNLAAIGIIVAASMGVSIIFTAIAPWLMRRVPLRWLVPALVVIEGLGIWLMSLHHPGLNLFGFLVPLQVGVAVLIPVVSTITNQRSPEAQRATVLSFQTGLFSLSMIVLFPLFGLGVTHFAYDAVYGWTLAGLIICVGAIGGMVRWRMRLAVRQPTPDA